MLAMHTCRVGIVPAQADHVIYYVHIMFTTLRLTMAALYLVYQTFFASLSPHRTFYVNFMELS